MRRTTFPASSCRITAAATSAVRSGFDSAGPTADSGGLGLPAPRGLLARYQSASEVGNAVLGASLWSVVDRSDPFRPAWTIRTPSGKQLRAEYDRLRNHWRVSPGEYVRRELADALSDATGAHRDAGWILQAVRQTSDDSATHNV